VLAAVAGVWLSAAMVSPALAQGRGGGPPPGGPPPGGGGGGQIGGPPFGGSSPGAGQPPSPGPGSRTGQTAESPVRADLQLGPPGRWWDDKSFVKSLKLRPDQQTRMDAIFEQNRNALLSRHESLLQAESQMEEVSKAPAPDEDALFTQIDRVARARAELEKAYTHMLLQIRKEMDADQISRLEKHR